MIPLTGKETELYNNQNSVISVKKSFMILMIAVMVLMMMYLTSEKLIVIL